MTQAIKKTFLRNKKPLLLAIGLAAVVTFFFGSSFLSLVHNKLEMRKLVKQSAELDLQYEELTAQLKRLQNQDLAYIEEIARIQYNMAKPNEVQFRLNP